MGLWDKLRHASGSVRNLRRSLGPDGYFQYKRWRIYERKQAERDRARDRKRATDSAERRSEKAERERGYEERYAREREGGIARERTEQAEEMEPDR
jgi:hypothetical protein